MPTGRAIQPAIQQAQCRRIMLFSRSAFPRGFAAPPQGRTTTESGPRDVMRTTIAAVLVVCLGFAAQAGAQDAVKTTSTRATGENYHVEIGGFLWGPTPEVDITSESLGIIGSKIDFVSD